MDFLIFKLCFIAKLLVWNECIVIVIDCTLTLESRGPTASVSGLALITANFANGKYEADKLALRKRRKPNPLHVMLGRLKTKEATHRNALLRAGKCTLKFAKANRRSNLARETIQFQKKSQPAQPTLQSWQKLEKNACWTRLCECAKSPLANGLNKDKERN